MTEQEINNGRLKAWDDYQKALETILTRKRTILEWAKVFQFISSQCKHTPLNLRQHHFTDMPTPDEIKELCSALEEEVKNYQHCRSEAMKFRWRVEESEV